MCPVPVFKSKNPSLPKTVAVELPRYIKQKGEDCINQKSRAEDLDFYTSARRELFKANYLPEKDTLAQLIYLTTFGESSVKVEDGTDASDEAEESVASYQANQMRCPYRQKTAIACKTSAQAQIRASSGLWMGVTFMAGVCSGAFFASTYRIAGSDESDEVDYVVAGAGNAASFLSGLAGSVTTGWGPHWASNAANIRQDKMVEEREKPHTVRKLHYNRDSNG